MPETSQPEPVTASTSRFGEIQVPFEKVITLPHGMVGFSKLRRYALLQHSDNSPFNWLQSLDEPDLAFAVVSPFIFDRGYQITLGKVEANLLQVSDVSQVQLWVVVTIPHGKPQEMTANLKAPLVINLKTNLGAQIILDDPRYDVRQKLPA